MPKGRRGKSRPVDSTAAGGALTYSRSIRKQCVDMAPRSWELIALSLLAGTHFTEQLPFLSEQDKDWIMGRAIVARLGWT